MSKIKSGGGTLCILSERKIRKKHHVSYDTILGMENAFAENAGVKIKELSVLGHKFNAVLNRFIKKTVSFNVDLPKTENVLFLAMGFSSMKNQRAILKKISIRSKLIVYCFDTWESEYKEWEELFSYIKPSYIFLAYQASVEYFSQKFSNVYFLPQSMDENFFYPRVEIEKTRLFMQMGRKNQKIHDMILHYLLENDIPDTNDNYVYERVPKNIIFPDTNELAENICRSKYFVCAPQSKENSQLTGKCSDVTARFYEAMACKTLIIGFKPATFDMIFPEDAMVELKSDGSDFAEKIKFFENHPEEYQRIVDRNYDLVMKKHRWQNRYEKIVSYIS